MVHAENCLEFPIAVMTCITGLALHYVGFKKKKRTLLAALVARVPQALVHAKLILAPIALQTCVFKE